MESTNGNFIDEKCKRFSVSLPAYQMELIAHICKAKGVSRSKLVRTAVENLILTELKNRDLFVELYSLVSKGAM